jgi:hypothetical protein
VGIAGGSTGLLLWPVVAVHAIVTALLARDLTEAVPQKT